MKSNKELFEELKNNISISRFEHEYSQEDKEHWRSYDMKKKIIAFSSACLVLISSVALAFNGEKKPEFPKKIENERKRIVDEYGVIDEETGIYTAENQKEMNEKLSEIYSTYPFKEIQEQYDKAAHPIISSGFISAFYHKEYNIEEDCYIMNSNGEKFKCSLSPSRKSNHSFIDNDKYDYYETYTLTKYDATDELTMVINYRGTREEIKLQKIK